MRRGKFSKPPLILQFYRTALSAKKKNELLSSFSFALTNSLFHISEENLCSRKINFGCSLEKLLEKSGTNFPISSWNNLTELYRQFPYIITYDENSINVALFSSISQKQMIMAYFHALVLGVIISQKQEIVSSEIVFKKVVGEGVNFLKIIYFLL